MKTVHFSFNAASSLINVIGMAQPRAAAAEMWLGIKKRIVIDCGLVVGCALLLLAASPARAAAEPGVSDNEIILGQSAPFTGAASHIGEQFNRGAQAYFDQVNAQGGVFGRKINLIKRDDGLVPERTQTNTTLLISQDNVFALFGYAGAANIKAAIPIFTEAKVPFFAASSGSDSLRAPFNRYIFNVRASNDREIEKIVEQLVTTYASNSVGVFYQYDSEGWTGLESVERTLKRFKLAPVAVGTVDRNSTDVAAAVASILPKAPATVIMICTYKPAAAFIKEMRRAGYRGQFVNISSVGSQALLAETGKDGYGVLVSQVVPFPWSPSVGVVMEYQKALANAGSKEFDFTSLEGFIAAKTLVEGLRRAGKNLTREKFIAALESLNKADLGDFTVEFSPTDHSQGKFVELTLIGSLGKFRK
jgi:branched-chain amino acid transport system substrate-binding protein